MSMLATDTRLHQPASRRDGGPGAVLWLTGLSGAGKSTLGVELARRLDRARGPVEYLDGDAIRQLFPRTGYDRTSRDEHVRRVGHLASRLEHHGILVIVALVSPYRESRAFARSLCRRFIEVHLSTALHVCEQRDVKGLYARARRHEIRGLTGVDDPYEPPERPELRIDTGTVTIDDAVLRVMSYCWSRGIVGANG